MKNENACKEVIKRSMTNVKPDESQIKTIESIRENYKKLAEVIIDNTYASRERSVGLEKIRRIFDVDRERNRIKSTIKGGLTSGRKNVFWSQIKTCLEHFSK